MVQFLQRKHESEHLSRKSKGRSWHEGTSRILMQSPVTWREETRYCVHLWCDAFEKSLAGRKHEAFFFFCYRIFTLMRILSDTMVWDIKSIAFTWSRFYTSPPVIYTSHQFKSVTFTYNACVRPFVRLSIVRLDCSHHGTIFCLTAAFTFIHHGLPVLYQFQCLWRLMLKSIWNYSCKIM